MAPSLLLFLFAWILDFQSTEGYYTPKMISVTTTTTGTTGTITTTVPPPPVKLHLKAVPDYPVAAGQTVELSCGADSVPDSVTWIWERLSVAGDKNSWREVDSRVRELSLTRPEQSGQYRCHAYSPSRDFEKSNVHSVYIVSIHTTAVDHLGIAGFVFSLLAFILSLAVLFWLFWQKFSATVTLPNTTKGHSITDKSTKDAPQADSEREVYMNYTCTNEGYTDLDPTNINEDNVYSSLS